MWYRLLGFLGTVCVFAGLFSGLSATRGVRFRDGSAILTRRSALQALPRLPIREMPAWMRGGIVPMALGPMDRGSDVPNIVRPHTSEIFGHDVARSFHSAARLWDGGDDPDRPPPNSFADPREDLTFKNLLGSPENKDLLLNFLNCVLDRRGGKTLTKVDLKKAESDNRGPGQKVFKMDLLCADQDGHQYIVEMEKNFSKNRRKPAFLSRIQFYGASVYADQMKERAQYEDLKPVICIVLTGTKLFKKGDVPGPLSRHIITEQGSRKSYFQDMQWVVVELPKFDLKEGELKTELDEWLHFFQSGYQGKRLPEKCSPTLEKAYSAIDQSKWTEQQRLAYRQWQIEEADRNEARTKAMLDGRKEGLIHGRKEGLIHGRKEGLIHGEKKGLLKAMERVIESGKMTQEEALIFFKISFEDLTAYRTETPWRNNDDALTDVNSWNTDNEDDSDDDHEDSDDDT